MKEFIRGKRKITPPMVMAIFIALVFVSVVLHYYEWPTTAWIFMGASTLVILAVLRQDHRHLRHRHR